MRGLHEFARSGKRSTRVLVPLTMCLLVVIGWASSPQSAVVRAGDVFLLVGGDTDQRLTLRTSNGEEREIFRPRAGRIFAFSVSPLGSTLAVLEQVLKFDVDPQVSTVRVKSRNIFEATTLHILARSGDVIDTLTQVRDFAWSPDGQQLTYVTGDYRGQDADFENTAVWIWNAKDQGRRMISKSGYYISWAGFDGNIYLWEKADGVTGRVNRYNVSTGSLEPTPHKSIYFSPSGEYYYHPGGGVGLPENIYYRSNDTTLKDRSHALLAFAGWRPILWAPDADLLLIEATKRMVGGGTGERTTVIYDPRADKVTDVGAVGSVSWGSSAKELVTIDGNRVEKRSLP
jgi:hypothetical protein